MRHNTDQIRPQSRGDLQQQVVVGRDAAAAFAGVDFDQHARRLTMRGDRARRIEIVGQHDDGGAGTVQLGDLIELLRCDADGIEDVGDAVAGEILRLRQGGNGDAAGLTGGRQPRHVDRLGGLHVRAQRHVMAREPARHGADVAQQDGAVEHQAGRGRSVQPHRRIPSSSAMRGVAFSPLPVSTSTVVCSGVIVPAASSLRNAAAAWAEVGST